MENSEKPQAEFFKETEAMFKENLAAKRIMVLDVEKNEILTNLNYDKVFFDSNLKLHKVNEKGAIEQVYNPNFKCVIVEA